MFGASVLTQFLSNQSQNVVAVGCRSKLVNVVSGVHRRRVLGPQLFPENKHCGDTDDSTFDTVCVKSGMVIVVPYHFERAAVKESLNRDFNRVNMWCDL